ncbi:MAG: molybdopterin-binding protein [Chloroflexota bacterium]
MYAEIIASGTELLMGEIQDTNSAFLASHLPSLGLEVRQVTLVGDDLEQYAEVLERAWRRTPFTFTTGGLGPTEDDLSREAHCEGVPRRCVC